MRWLLIAKFGDFCAPARNRFGLPSMVVDPVVIIRSLKRTAVEKLMYQAGDRREKLCIMGSQSSV